MAFSEGFQSFVCEGDTAKVQKQIIGNRVTGSGCEPNPDCRPAWMQVPPTCLVEGAGSPPDDAWDRIAGMFEGREDTGAPETQALDQPDAA